MRSTNTATFASYCRPRCVDDYDIFHEFPLVVKNEWLVGYFAKAAPRTDARWQIWSRAFVGFFPGAAQIDKPGDILMIPDLEQRLDVSIIGVPLCQPLRGIAR